MFKKRFNSKYAGEIPKFDRSDIEGLAGAGIYDVPERDDYETERSINSAPDRQLVTRTSETPSEQRTPLVNRRPDASLDPSERVERIIQDPEGVAQRQIVSEIARQHNPEHRGTDKRASFQRSISRLFRGAGFVAHKTLRDAYPCPECGGANNGGKPLMPAGMEHLQEYCPGCYNKGYKITVPCPTCKGEGNDCETCSGAGAFHVPIEEHLYNIHRQAALSNAAWAFHKKYCSSKQCDSKCSINNMQQTCGGEYGCGGSGRKGPERCSHCNGKGTIGAVDALRRDYEANEQKKYDDSSIQRKQALTEGVYFTKQEAGKISLDAMSDKNKFKEEGDAAQEASAAARVKAFDTTEWDEQKAPRKKIVVAPEDLDKVIGAQYQKQPIPKNVTHAESGSPRRTVETVGKTGVVDSYEPPAPQFDTNKAYDAPLKRGDWVHIHNNDFSNPDAYLRKGENQETFETHSQNAEGFVKSPMRQRQIEDTQNKERGYVDPLTVGVVDAIGDDGTLEVIAFGRNVQRMRNERMDRLKGVMKGMREVVKGKKDAFDTTRRSSDTETKAFGRSPGNNKKQAVATQLSSIYGEVTPYLGEGSPVHKPHSTIMQVHPGMVSRLTEVTAPILGTVGHTVGGYAVGHTGTTADNTTKVQHRIGMAPWSVGRFRDAGDTALDPTVRRRIRNLGRYMDEIHGVEPGSPESLVSPRPGADSIAKPKKKKQRGTTPLSKEKKFVESPLDKMLPRFPTIEVPGAIPHHKSEEGRKSMLQNVESQKGKSLSADEKKRFLEAVDNNDGEIDAGLRELGMETGKENE